jgi:hypothetical protein
VKSDKLDEVVFYWLYPRKQINGKTLFLPVEGENLRKKRVKTRLFDEKKKSTRINTFLCTQKVSTL